MSDMRSQMVKAFRPEVAIDVIHLGKVNIAAVITKEIYTFLERKHLVMLDSANGVIYLKRKEVKNDSNTYKKLP